MCCAHIRHVHYLPNQPSPIYTIGISYYSWPVLLRVGGWVDMVIHMLAPCLYRGPTFRVFNNVLQFLHLQWTEQEGNLRGSDLFNFSMSTLYTRLRQVAETSCYRPRFDGWNVSSWSITAVSTAASVRLVSSSQARNFGVNIFTARQHSLLCRALYL